MAKYDFLKTMSLDELVGLKNATTDTKLISNILAVLGSDEDKYSKYFYTSDRTKYIDPALDCKYLEVIGNLRTEALNFYQELACKGKGNNAGVCSGMGFLDDSILIYSYPGMREKLEIHGINNVKKFHYLYTIGKFQLEGSKERYLYDAIKYDKVLLEAEEEVKYFKYLDEFFKDENNKTLYEGAYNSYMYLKEYFYRIISEKDVVPITYFIDDFMEKVSYTKLYLQQICQYLLDIKLRVPESRLSAFNNKIRFPAKGITGELTKSQLDFAGLLAFGTTKENLKNQNFEDFERLIYVPRKKL